MLARFCLSLKVSKGLRYSTHEDSFTFADNLPLDWTFMEFQVPVQKEGSISWVKARAERRELEENLVVKTVTVENNPFKNLIVQPWTEDAKLLTASPKSKADPNTPIGHAGWVFSGESANVVINLGIK